jgi:hypothetical protein
VKWNHKRKTEDVSEKAEPSSTSALGFFFRYGCAEKATTEVKLLETLPVQQLGAS